MRTHLTSVQRAHEQGQYVHYRKRFLNLTILPDGLSQSRFNGAVLATPPL